MLRGVASEGGGTGLGARGGEIPAASAGMTELLARVGRSWGAGMTELGRAGGTELGRAGGELGLGQLLAEEVADCFCGPLGVLDVRPVPGVGPNLNVGRRERAALS